MGLDRVPTRWETPPRSRGPHPTGCEFVSHKSCVAVDATSQPRIADSQIEALRICKVVADFDSVDDSCTCRRTVRVQHTGKSIGSCFRSVGRPCVLLATPASMTPRPIGCETISSATLTATSRVHLDVHRDVARGPWPRAPRVARESRHAKPRCGWQREVKPIAGCDSGRGSFIRSGTDWGEVVEARDSILAGAVPRVGPGLLRPIAGAPAVVDIFYTCFLMSRG